MTGSPDIPVDNRRTGRLPEPKQQDFTILIRNPPDRMRQHSRHLFPVCRLPKPDLSLGFVRRQLALAVKLQCGGALFVVRNMDDQCVCKINIGVCRTVFSEPERFW